MSDVSKTGRNVSTLFSRLTRLTRQFYLIPYCEVRLLAFMALGQVRYTDSHLTRSTLILARYFALIVIVVDFPRRISDVAYMSHARQQYFTLSSSRYITSAMPVLYVETLYNSSLVCILIIQRLPSLMSYVLAKQLSEGVYQYRLRKCPRNGDGCVQEGLVG